MNPRDGQNIEWGIHYLSFGIPAMLVQMAAVVIFILINAKAIENGTPYEVGDPNERPASVPEVPIWTYVLPVVPVALSIVFQWDSVPALFLAAIIAFFGTGYMKTYKGFVSILNSTAKTAIGDIGSLIIMLLVLRFFQHAAVTVMADFGRRSQPWCRTTSSSWPSPCASSRRSPCSAGRWSCTAPAPP